MGLKDEQAAQFKQLRQAHFDKVKDLKDQLRAERKVMFEALMESLPSDTVKAFRASEKIGQIEGEIERLLIQHYLELQAVCTPEQQQKLGAVFKKALPKPPHPPKHKGGDRKPK